MNNQKGFTLVELLVAVLIFTFVLLFSTTLLINSMNTEKNVSADIVLRDEADYILSSLVKEIYTMKESEYQFVDEPSKNNYYLYKINEPSNIIGFKDQQIYTNNSSITPSRVNVLWNKTEIIVTENATSNRTYNITLTLETMSDRKVEKTFKTEVQSINDKINDN